MRTITKTFKRLFMRLPPYFRQCYF